MLVVVRTITTVAYLFDALPELLEDERVQILFTKNGEDSAYEAGVAEAVRERGGRMLPWRQAISTRFDLAIGASHYGGLEELSSPLLILPHGPGYTKTISRPDDGVPPQPVGSLTSATRNSVTVMLSHSEQRQQWRGDPASGIHITVIGDPVFDRLEASLPERAEYKRALGLREQQKLIAISSTWGPEALLAQRPSIASDLLAELPVDEYAVAALLHSNIWVGHGQWQLRLWLRRALEAGLRLIPYQDGSWRSALVASDLLIGDHGSVTFYGATLGIPVALGAFSEREVVDGTPVRALGERAPRVDPSCPLRRQLEAIGFELDAGRYSDLAARSFANRGKALDELRGVIYRLIDLDPPQRPIRLTPAAPPSFESPGVTAFLAVTRLKEADGTDESRTHVSVERFPAALEPPHAAADPTRHLVVSTAERHRGLREGAAAIVRPLPPDAPNDPFEEAVDWGATTLDAFPGCRLAVAGVGANRCVIVLRDEPPIAAQVDPELDLGLLASAVYAWAVAAPPGSGLPRKLMVSAGKRRIKVKTDATFQPQLEPT